MKATQERASYADLERWPEDGRRYELYDGEVFEIPSLYRLSGARCVLAGTARNDEPITSALLPELHLRPSDLLPGSSH